MPTVKLYGSPQVQQAPIPGVRRTAAPTADTFGANIGEAIAQGGRQVGEAIGYTGRVISHEAEKIYREERDRADAMRVEEELNNARKAQVDLTFGESGYINAKGKNVMERASGKPISEEYLEQFDKHVEGAQARLSGPRQQQVYARHVSALRNELYRGLRTHEAAQIQAHYVGVADGTLASEANNAALRFNDPEAIERSEARYAEAIERRADLGGISGEQRTAFRTQKLSDFHKGVIATALSGGYLDRAKSYFESRQGQIDAGDRIAIETNIKATTARLEAETWDQVGNGINQAENRIFENPSSFASERASQLRLIDSLPNVSERMRIKIRDEMETRLITAQVLGEAEIDAPGTAAKLRGKVGGDAPAPVGSFDSAVMSLLKREGGYVASDGKSKAPANFGINQKANPDVDVKNLTKAQAIEIYRNRYWNKIGGDNLPQATALVALDTAAHQGVSVAKQLIADTGGDPGLMIARRREQLQALAAKDPEHAKQLSGWMKRLDSLQAEAAGIMPTGERLPKTGDNLIDNMPLKLRFQLLRQVETQVHQQQALERQRLNGQMQDFEAIAKSGQEIPMQQIPQESALKRAYGDVEGAAIYANRIAPLLTMNADIREVSRLSSDEQMQLIRSREPVPGEGFALAQRRQAQLAEAIKHDQQQRKDDPGAYVFQHSPRVKSAFEETMKAEASKDPNAIKRAYTQYAETVIAEQTRLGMPKALLSKQMANQIVSRFYEQKEGGQNAAQLIQGLSDQWGKHWGVIYGQIAKEIPSAARTIGAGMPEPAAMMLAGVADIKTKDLKEGMPGDVSKDISTYLEKSFEQGRISLLTTNPRSGTETYVSTFGDAEKLALVYALKGKSATEAAQQAYEDTFGHRYEFVSSGPGVFRVPKGQNPTTIASGARVVLNSVDDMALELPVSRAGLDPEQIKAAWNAQLKADAYWVTAPDESGLMLYHANGGAVLDVKGQPIWRSWFALEQAGRSGTVTAPTPETATRRTFGSTPGGAPTAAIKRNPTARGPGPTLGGAY